MARRYFKVHRWDFWIFTWKERLFWVSVRLKNKKAVERNIEIIGEAVNRITNYKNAEIEIQNARQIIGTRNRIAHDYDNISDEVIWTIIIRELPKLKDEITKLRNWSTRHNI